MKAKEVREKYTNFFKSEPRNHIEIPPAPLVLEEDPTTLFTSSGMQPLVPYLMGEQYPSGAKRLVDSQPSIRTVDIEEVGDYSHLTFFEMLGNWSLGDYFKTEQIPWIFEFFTKELGLDKERLRISVFEGNGQVPKDDKSYNTWKSLGVAEDKIYFYGVEKNWWSRSGTPDKMPVGEIGGPDSEIFYDFGEEQKIHENSLFKNEKCHPNCQCGRFLEIGNCVFIQYKKAGKGKLEELPQKNVDFGGGLERITAAVNNTADVFMTDLFRGIIEEAEKKYEVKYGESQNINKSLRVIADHSRAATALISSGVAPSNKTHGYILRRLIRRALIHARRISKDKAVSLPVIDLAKFGIAIEIKTPEDIKNILEEETNKFKSVMDLGIRKLLSLVKKGQKVSGEVAFNLYQSYGFPLDLTLEVLENEGLKFTEKDRDNFKKEFEKHQELSRTTSAGVFKGGLADHSPEVIKLHTATHLLLASLREVLGDHVVQKGQNITHERSRFDFPNPEKLTDEQLKEVEDGVNEIISKDLPVNYKVMSKEEALKTGAIHAFNEKYADTVKVYFVGGSIEDAASREFCGGPHVSHTGEIGRVRIKKQERIGSGLIRIYIVLENSKLKL